ncbi:exosome catalytic subunit dis3 [Dispira simplex]|nr:exosome catalytic subunit dis3 [Dispira simplex]
MLRSKAFMKKTRKGNVVRVEREHYLRDDIVCSVDGCNRCDFTGSDTLLVTNTSNKFTVSHPVLGRHPRQTARFTTPSLVVPDTNVLLNQIDIIEHPALKDVVILQTCLNELRNLSLPTYHRLRTVIQDPDRRFYVFSNEHHRDTFVDRLKDESPNDRNDRAIRRAVQWYVDHLTALNPPVSALMLTDDADNRRKATEAGIPNSSVVDYFKELVDYPELLDMIAQVSLSHDTADRRVHYPEYVTKLQYQAGLKSNKYIQGSMNISHHNFLEGHIFGKVDGEERSIAILGREHMNRAIQGDIVVVELLPKSEWQRTPTEILLNEEEAENDDGTPVEGQENGKGSDNASVSTSDNSAIPAQPTGKVVAIVRRNWRAYCGHLDPKAGRNRAKQSGAQGILFLPMDSRIPRIKIRTRQVTQLLGQRVVVAIDSWPSNSKHPLGHFIKALGSAGDRTTETEVLLMEHDVPYQEFSRQVLADLPVEGDEWIVQDQHLKNRQDLRHLDVCSIDPPGCTDIDDALHCVLLPNGNYQVGVHIADVTHFVKPNTAMDKEAARRCTTVYLVDRRIDMLPALLGTNLCSLRSHVDRLAFSCMWELDTEANIVDVRFTKSVIRSRHSFTYDEAQSRIEDGTLQDTVTLGIRNLNQLAKNLRARRMAKGALTLASPEVRFNLENDSQDPVDVELKELKDTNALVEEFMLLANISVAKRVYETFPDTSMLRRHPAPPPSSFELLAKSLKDCGFELNASSSKDLSNSLDHVVKPDNPYFNKLVRIMTTRCMMQAVYFCSGTVPEEEFWHYGLATPIYTHFTSPIRRYADVLVHRLLQACIDREAPYDPSILDKNRMKEQSDALNYRHRMAQQASRSSVELFTHMFFRHKKVLEEGHVIRVLKNGFSVLIPRYGIEGFVYASTRGPEAQKQEILQYDPSSNTLHNSASNTTITIFSKVKVLITVEKESLEGTEHSTSTGDQPTLREKMQVHLVEPAIPELSVPVPADATVGSSNKLEASSLPDGTVVVNDTGILKGDIARNSTVPSKRQRTK